MRLAATMFSAIFFIVRIFFYGYVIMDFQYQYFAHRDQFPSWADPMLTLAILSVFSLGWVLQLFWARMVWSKSIKTLKTLMGMKKSTQGQHIARSLLS
mmetsp:Transcript_3964/g.5606  ORF Transcript_3964/g.5606 Transcript_3964/m.5606 type:complete len:98 (-) Transcript_3964:32-325(-)